MSQHHIDKANPQITDDRIVGGHPPPGYASGAGTYG